MDRGPASELKTAPETPICGAKWNSAGHCRQSNSSQNLVSIAPPLDVPATDLLALTGPSPDRTVDNNAMSSALESTGSMIPAHITRTTSLRSNAGM